MLELKRIFREFLDTEETKTIPELVKYLTEKLNSKFRGKVIDQGTSHANIRGSCVTSDFSFEDWGTAHVQSKLLTWTDLRRLWEEFKLSDNYKKSYQRKQ